VVGGVCTLGIVQRGGGIGELAGGVQLGQQPPAGSDGERLGEALSPLPGFQRTGFGDIRRGGLPQRGGLGLELIGPLQRVVTFPLELAGSLESPVPLEEQGDCGIGGLCFEFGDPLQRVRAGLAGDAGLVVRGVVVEEREAARQLVEQPGGLHGRHPRFSHRPTPVKGRLLGRGGRWCAVVLVGLLGDTPLRSGGRAVKGSVFSRHAPAPFPVSCS
jgi:hypothetical protein